MVYYKKKGFPEIGEIVLCKAVKILPHSVFLEILEYKDKQGMLHISEISSKWIKNINNYVQVGQKLICKVEDIDKKKGYIDLSLKRVSGGEKKRKMKEVKKENRVEKMFEYAGKKKNVSIKNLYKKYLNKILKNYEFLQLFYEDFKEHGEEVFKEYKFNKELKEEIIEQFKKAIKKSKATIKKEIRFISEGKEGINNIKKFVKELMKLEKGYNKLSIKYIDSPRYLLSIESKNYKQANNFFEDIMEKIEELKTEYNIRLVK